MITHKPTPTGFHHEAVDQSAYVLGGLTKLPFESVRHNSSWLELLPLPEYQSPYFETYSCTAHATINAIQMLQLQKFGESEDYSERFLANVSGTIPGGNNPHTVAEYIRKVGLVEESLYPTLTAKTWEEYYGTIPPKVFEIARQWLLVRDFGHEYIPTDSDAIFDCLKTSPVGVSVAGWYEEDGMYIKPQGVSDNHWTLIVSAVKGHYFLVYDSYAPFIKKLPWGYKFGIAKRYHLSEKKQAVTCNLICRIIKFLKSL